MDKAYVYSYGDRMDFDFALIPIHIRNDVLWKGNHWMLAIYDKRGTSGRNYCYVYDPKKIYGENGKIKPAHRELLRHLLDTLHETKCKGTIITPLRLNFNLQPIDDIISSGIYICYYAEQYLLLDGIADNNSFNVDSYRHQLYERTKESSETQRYKAF